MTATSDTLNHGRPYQLTEALLVAALLLLYAVWWELASSCDLCPLFTAGYGFVDFESPSEALMACQSLQTQGIMVQFAKVPQVCSHIATVYGRWWLILTTSRQK